MSAATWRPSQAPATTPSGLSTGTSASVPAAPPTAPAPRLSPVSASYVPRVVEPVLHQAVQHAGAAAVRVGVARPAGRVPALGPRDALELLDLQAVQGLGRASLRRVGALLGQHAPVAQVDGPRPGVLTLGHRRGDFVLCLGQGGGEWSQGDGAHGVAPPRPKPAAKRPCGIERRKRCPRD